MAKIMQVDTGKPGFTEGDTLLATYWRCDACGDPVTPNAPGIAKWPFDDESGGFQVVHKAQCDGPPSPTSWLDLNRLMASLSMHSLGDPRAAASLEELTR